MQEKNSEQTRVTEFARTANYTAGVMQYSVEYCGEIFMRHIIRKGGVLELGPAEGVMTDLLYPHFSEDYTVVDGADFFVESLKSRYPKITGYVSLFEDFQPDRLYSNIILGHVLEHVENPVEVLKLCATWLKPNGRILSAVPNSNSLHRQAAVEMGLLTHCKELNATDKKNGHRRVYDMAEFQKDFLDAGLSIKKSGGYWLKTLSNAQIEKDWTVDMIKAYLKIGELYPDIAAEIYVVAEKSD